MPPPLAVPFHQILRSMESVNTKAKRLNSPFVVILRWVALLPVGLGILWFAEWFATILVDLVLNWNLGKVPLFVVVIGGGYLLFYSIVLFGAGMRMLTNLLAPHYRIGAILLSMTYLLIQIVGLFNLFVAAEPTWQYILTKMEFTGIVVYMLLFSSQRAKEEELA